MSLLENIGDGELFNTMNKMIAESFISQKKSLFDKALNHKVSN